MKFKECMGSSFLFLVIPYVGKNKDSKTHLGVLESKQFFITVPDAQGIIPPSAHHVVKQAFLYSVSYQYFSPWGSPMLPLGYIIHRTPGQHFHTTRVQ